MRTYQEELDKLKALAYEALSDIRWWWFRIVFRYRFWQFRKRLMKFEESLGKDIKPVLLALIATFDQFHNQVNALRGEIK